MVVVFRTKGEDWDKFTQTLRSSSAELHELGCKYVQAYRNRKHQDEWLMLQEWTDKATFDKFAESRGPELDRDAGVRWTDVSTWEESAFPPTGG
ncbi:MAG TPA: antibiotic biosynthesis monooxygenase [Solirubrobacterales bacterium]|nr:antibiotic biosynthesis monooxygenase [Solirubrobacterales bacterium]